MRRALNIRPAVPPDADDVVALVRQSFRPADLDLTIYGCAGIAEYLRTQFALTPDVPSSTYLVATIEDCISGFVELRGTGRGLCLNYIVIHPDWRGAGVARELLATALRHRRPPAGSEFTLDVFEHNHAAMSWYSGMGFQRLGRKAFWRVELQGCAPPEDPVGEGPVRITGMSQANTTHDAFGFSSFMLSPLQPARTFTVGRLGERWFRVTDEEFLRHSQAVRVLTAIDPRREILFHGAEEAIPTAIRERCTPLLWNIHMGRRL